MKTETREVYTTNDGKEFTDLTEAMSYEAALENEILIDEYIATLVESSERAKSRVKNDIKRFIGFQAVYQNEKAAKPKKAA